MKLSTALYFVACCAAALPQSSAFLPMAALATRHHRISISPSVVRMSSSEQIVSPFDNTNSDADGAGGASTTATTTATKLEGPLDLTWENVDAVLEEMRPFLLQDGGNVIISDIDGPVVRLELQVR
jgi:lysyl-tRNA synthetase class 2